MAAITRTDPSGFTVTETNNSLTRTTPTGFTLTESTVAATGPVTRLGLSGFTRPPYASFEGKTPLAVGGIGPRLLLTGVG